jgi:hypothetical protein
MGQHFFSLLFLLCIIFSLQVWVFLKTLNLCGRIDKDDIEENQHQLRICITKVYQYQYLQVEDLLRLLIMKLLVDLKLEIKTTFQCLF